MKFRRYERTSPMQAIRHVGCVNARPFFGRPAETVLLVGMRGGVDSPDGDTLVEYVFAEGVENNIDHRFWWVCWESRSPNVWPGWWRRLCRWLYGRRLSDDTGLYRKWDFDVLKLIEGDLIRDEDIRQSLAGGIR